MKTKKFEKKLTLNKKTIADLSNSQLGIIKGAIQSFPGLTCPTVSLCICKITGCTGCQTCADTCTCVTTCFPVCC
jgi:hypothetical protein